MSFELKTLPSESDSVTWFRSQMPNAILTAWVTSYTNFYKKNKDHLRDKK